VRFLNEFTVFHIRSGLSQELLNLVYFFGSVHSEYLHADDENKSQNDYKFLTVQRKNPISPFSREAKSYCYPKPNSRGNKTIVLVNWHDSRESHTSWPVAVMRTSSSILIPMPRYLQKIDDLSFTTVIPEKCFEAWNTKCYTKIESLPSILF